MIKPRFFTGAVLFLITFFLSQALYSQPQRGGGGIHRVTGWADDTHFIYQTTDSGNRPVTLSVDIRTGKSIPYIQPESPRDIFVRSLPAGVNIGLSDILSPDSRSAVFIR
ncbi:MAG: hypothetical protein GYA43_05790, partial [Bacteroidales bacterium]|nr:hypothetical protein [Bacteroidales bacterium]